MLIADLMAQSGVGFGTSGARGRVVDMTPEVCYAYTRGFLQHLEQAHGLVRGCQVAIAGDLRPSTQGIMAAVAKGCLDAGYQPLNCGFIPSPAVALYGIQNGIPSVMVTGSHIPDDRNGIKFNRVDGEVLKSDEAGIRAQDVEVPEKLTGLESSLPELNLSASSDYLQRYVDFFGERALSGMRVGVYEHSGVGRDLLVEILEKLGAEVVRLARSKQFIPVDTEAIRPEDTELAAKWATEQAFNAIVSTDGDADRPLVSDENGVWLRGDVAGVLCGKFLEIQNIATPVSSNSVVEKSNWFQSVGRTRIGSPFVIEVMQQLAADGKSTAGYEANGGFLLQTPIIMNGKTLESLPTRDAFIVILAILAMSKSTGKSISQLVAALPPRFTSSDRLKAFPTEKSQAIIAQLAKPAEGGDYTPIEAAFGDLCGAVKMTNATDGLRITFNNDEVVHLRPSGNAPEFRCYNEAASTRRVAELNELCMAKLEDLRSAQAIIK